MKRIIELATRLHVFFLLNLYGLGKIIGGQFYRHGNLPPEIASQTLGNVETYALGWTFMGHSYMYILFIGLSQIIGAWLLLWNRTKFLGILLLLPILSNIIIFDIIYLPTKGALASATIYFLELLFVLWANSKEVKSVFQSLTAQSLQSYRLIYSPIKHIILALGVTGLIFAVEQLLVNLIGH